MHAFWICMKENMQCGGKLTEVVCRENDLVKRKRTRSEQQPKGELSHPMQNLTRELMLRPKYMLKRYQELEIGDQSRNIIEIIIRAASTQPTKHSNIKKVIKVNNSVDILERFERYREAVKKRSYEQCKEHPRSTVDGNELLQFYGTTMSCLTRKSKISELCKVPTCRMCRLIQSGFNTSYNKMNGIRLSTSSDELGEDTIVVSKGKNVKRAVIVCRTIAGRVVNMEDEAFEEEYDSVRNGVFSRIQYLNIRHLCSVLACFIVVFS